MGHQGCVSKTNSVNVAEGLGIVKGITITKVKRGRGEVVLGGLFRRHSPTWCLSMSLV